MQAWLGRTAAAADALVVQAPDSQALPAASGVAHWDPDNKLGLTVAFPGDDTLVVWLDKTLPQVCACDAARNCYTLLQSLLTASFSCFLT